MLGERSYFFLSKPFNSLIAIFLFPEQIRRLGTIGGLFGVCLLWRPRVHIAAQHPRAPPGPPRPLPAVALVGHSHCRGAEDGGVVAAAR